MFARCRTATCHGRSSRSSKVFFLFFSRISFSYSFEFKINILFFCCCCRQNSMSFGHFKHSPSHHSTCNSILESTENSKDSFANTISTVADVFQCEEAIQIDLIENKNKKKAAPFRSLKKSATTSFHFLERKGLFLTTFFLNNVTKLYFVN